MPVCRYRGGGGCWCVSAVGEVVAQAGPAPPCPAGDAGLVAGGEGTPGAGLADAGGHEQQRGEDRLCGDAADAAACGLGEGFVGGVFDELAPSTSPTPAAPAITPRTPQGLLRSCTST